MSGDFSTEGKIELKFISNLSQFIDDLARYNQETGFSNKETQKLQSALEKVEGGFKGTGSSASGAASSNAKYAASLQPMIDKLEKFVQLQKEAAQERTAAAINAGAPLAGINRESIKAMPTRELEELSAVNAARNFNPVAEVDRELAARRRATSAINDQAAATDKLSGATKQGTANTISQRYALYDVATTTGVASAALLGLVGAYTSVAVARQAAFTEVQRTTELPDGPAADALRAKLEALTNVIPKSFGEISQIATVGAQMNVPTEALAGFTETIVKFSAVTGVASETAALAFGKIGNVLKLTSQEYAAFAGAIAYAGVKSAATEAQILSVANKLGPIMALYRSTATEVAGLSAAYASVGVEAELASGTTQRVWAKIQMAVDGGGERLRNFATVAGMSSDEFKRSWSESSAQTYAAFLKGLGASDSYAASLRVLGINATRDGRALGALASAGDLAAKSLKDAADGATNGFMDESAAKKFETVAAKIEILKNNIEELADAMGGPTLDVLAGFISFLGDAAHNLAVFAKTPVGQAIVPLVTGLLAVIGILGALVTGVAITTASMLALRTAIMAVDGQLTGAQFAAARFVGSMFGVELSANKATGALAGTTRGARALKIALASTGFGLLALLAGAVVGGIMETADGQSELEDATEGANEQIANQYDLMLEDAEAMRENVGAAMGFIQAQAAMEASLRSLGESMSENGKSFSAYSKGGQANIQALSGVINSMMKEAGDDPQRLANLLAGLAKQLHAAGVGADGLRIVRDTMDAVGVSATSAAVTSNSLAVGLATVSKKSKEAAKDIRTVVDYARDLDSVMSRSFQLRFGSQSAFDGITSKFLAMKKSSEDAAKKVRDLRLSIDEVRATIQGLTADRRIEEYFLSVAVGFGDTLRASQISSNIAKIDAEIAKNKGELVDKNSELSEAQELVNRSLSGNSAAAIAARGDVLALVGAYQAYLQELAASGMSQEELARVSASLRGEFESQLTQMGYNSDEVAHYSQAFADFTAIIQNFPRDVTLEVTADPAQQAINEFLAKNANHKLNVDIATDPEAAGRAGSRAGNALGTGARNEITDIMSGGNGGGGGGRGGNWLEDIWNNLTSFFTDVNKWVTATVADTALKFTMGLRMATGGGRVAGGGGGGGGFYDGGYTGNIGTREVAGEVHGQEFVFSAPAVRRIGVDRLAYEHQRARRGYAGGGEVGGSNGPWFGAGMGGGDGVATMDLSPLALQALEGVANRPVFLTLQNGQVLGQLVQHGAARETRGM